MSNSFLCAAIFTRAQIRYINSYKILPQHTVGIRSFSSTWTHKPCDFLPGVKGNERLTLLSICSFGLTGSREAQHSLLTFLSPGPSVRWRRRWCIFPSALTVLSGCVRCLHPAVAVWTSEHAIRSFNFCSGYEQFLLQGIRGAQGRHIWRQLAGAWGARVGARGTRAVRGQRAHRLLLCHVQWALSGSGYTPRGRKRQSHVKELAPTAR